jgi:hypothetical protein
LYENGDVTATKHVDCDHVVDGDVILVEKVLENLNVVVIKAVVQEVLQNGNVVQEASVPQDVSVIKDILNIHDINVVDVNQHRDLLDHYRYVVKGGMLRSSTSATSTRFRRFRSVPARTALPSHVHDAEHPGREELRMQVRLRWTCS